MSAAQNDETYSEEETKRRAAAALKRMLQTPHKPHSKISLPSRRSRVARNRTADPSGN
jgi:hypothetical protein